jgi:hypothetical protein
MGGFPIFPRVVHYMVFKGDTALGVLIRKLEIVKDLPALCGVSLARLCLSQCAQSVGAQL